MSEALSIVVTSILASFGTTGAIALLIYFYPEKAEKWWSFFLKILLKCRFTAHGLHKRYVLHDIQGHVNDFIKKCCSKLPGVEAKEIKLQFVDGTVSKEAILDGRSIIVRVRRNDPRDKNFVHAVHLFVSKCLLFKAKRYLSTPQKQATELFVSMKLLESEKPAIVDHFLEDYLHPKIENAKSATSKVFDDLAVADDQNLFFPVYLRELNFLGEKVFGGRRDQQIIEEVNNLIRFLKELANRKVGQEVDLDFQGNYCRFAVVIVGRQEVLSRDSIEPYVRFIRNKLMPNGVETIYLLSVTERTKYLKSIAGEVKKRFVHFADAEFVMKLRYDHGGVKKQLVRLLVLRAYPKKLYYSSNQ